MTSAWSKTLAVTGVLLVLAALDLAAQGLEGDGIVLAIAGAIPVAALGLGAWHKAGPHGKLRPKNIG